MNLVSDVIAPSLYKFKFKFAFCKTNFVIYDLKDPSSAYFMNLFSIFLSVIQCIIKIYQMVYYSSRVEFGVQ